MTEYDDTFDRMADRIESLEKQLADEREQHIRTRHQRNERYESSRANYDEVNQLRQQLADERTEHARTTHGRDTMQAELDRARDQIEALNRVIKSHYTTDAILQACSVPMADELQQARRALERTEHQMADLESCIKQLQSQPRLQRVTPEAMAEIESSSGAVLIVFVPDKQGPVRIIRRFYGKDVGWYAVTNNYTIREPRPTQGVFLDLSAIPEEPQ